MALKDLKTDEGESSPWSSMKVGRTVASLVRRVADAENIPLTSLLERMLVAYVERHHPEWELVFDDSTAHPEKRRPGRPKKGK